MTEIVDYTIRLAPATVAERPAWDDIDSTCDIKLLHADSDREAAGFNSLGKPVEPKLCSQLITGSAFCLGYNLGGEYFVQSSTDSHMVDVLVFKGDRRGRAYPESLLLAQKKIKFYNSWRSVSYFMVSLLRPDGTDVLEGGVAKGPLPGTMNEDLGIDLDFRAGRLLRAVRQDFKQGKGYRTVIECLDENARGFAGVIYKVFVTEGLNCVYNS